MNVLEQVLDFEKEAESIINGARKNASELILFQEKEVKNIQKDFEAKIAKEKESLKKQLNQRLLSISKEEGRKKEDILNKIKLSFSNNVDKAVKIITDNIIN